MRRRYQEGSLKNVDGRWIAQWWDNGQRRKRTLGLVSNTPKSEAKVQLAAILSPINARYAGPSVQTALGDFLKNVYLPFYRRKWKNSTYMTNAERLKVHMLADLGGTPLGELTRDGLQDYLDRKAAAGLSNSMVSHMRWDLRQILRLAVADGHIMKNPAEELFVPRSAARAVKKVMSMKEVNDCISSLERRESLIAKLALLVGLRPGEIFALRCGCFKEGRAEIRERIYRNELDSPKTHNSIREAALPVKLYHEVLSWIANLPANGEADWVFPSERPSKPLAADNAWRRNMKEKLEGVGLGWVNFQVFRRTHATLMKASGADPKLVADNMGHTLDVNQNVYTQSSLTQRIAAVDTLAAGVYIN